MTQLVSQACLRNQEPIFNVLKEYITQKSKVLEIGSGSAQHAQYFAQRLPLCTWFCSDQSQYHPAIEARLLDSGLSNVRGPFILRIGVDDFPKESFDYVYSANTLHIMSWKECKALFKLLGKRLREGSLVFFYGPFNYSGQYTSESNKIFDESLKLTDSSMGIRNYEDVKQSMLKNGFKLLKDHSLPANNHILVFERLEFKKADK